MIAREKSVFQRKHPPDTQIKNRPPSCNKGAGDFERTAASHPNIHNTIGRAQSAIAVAVCITGRGAKGTLYEVTLEGEVIVGKTINPEYDAARALAARGFAGPFDTLDAVSGTVRMMFPSIAAAARLTVVEEDRRGLRVRRWRGRVGPFGAELATMASTATETPANAASPISEAQGPTSPAAQTTDSVTS